jgi:ABC-2 type transport system permease protein
MRAFAGREQSLHGSVHADLQLVVGHWLGVLALYVVMLLITAIDVAVLSIYGRPEWGWIAGGYLGLLLLGAAFASLALVLSALARSALIAGMLTCAASLLFWTVHEIVAYAPPAVRLAVGDLSLLDRYDDFAKGVIDTGNVLYYTSVVVLGMVLTTLILRARHSSPSAAHALEGPADA